MQRRLNGRDETTLKSSRQSDPTPPSPRGDGICESLGPVNPRGGGGRGSDIPEVDLARGGARTRGVGGRHRFLRRPQAAPLCGSPACWEEQLKGDATAAGAQRHGGDAFLLKPMVSGESRRPKPPAEFILGNFGVADDCRAALSPGLLGKR